MAETWKKMAFEDDCVLVADVDASGYGFVIDDDTMAAATDLLLSTSESIKAYVDAAGGTSFAVAAVLGTL